MRISKEKESYDRFKGYDKREKLRTSVENRTLF